MFRKSLLSVCLLIFTLTCLHAQDENSAHYRFLNFLKDKNFEKAYSFFDSTVTKTFKIEQLQSAWSQVETQYGKLISIDPGKTDLVNDRIVKTIPLRFEKGTIDAKIAVNKFDNLIAGFFLTPRPEDTPYINPPYTDTLKFSEKEVKFGAEPYIIPGAISLPKSSVKTAVLILLHGAGPQDRDESIGPNKPFRDIAEGLAGNNIAVLRFDKRTKVHYGKQFVNNNEINLNIETIDDAVAAVKYLSDNADKFNIDKNKIFVLGHSMSGGLIPRISGRTDIPKGFIIMAGYARRIDKAILDQYSYLFNIDSVYSDDEKAQFADISEKIATMMSPKLGIVTPLDSLPFGIGASYWLDYREIDISKDAKKITKPTLVIQGGRDYQVTKEDFDIWKEALKNYTKADFKLYPSLNHLFMNGTGKITPAEYYDRNFVAEEVIKDITAFVNKN